MHAYIERYMCCYFSLHRQLYLSPLICYIAWSLYNQGNKIELLGLDRYCSYSFIVVVVVFFLLIISSNSLYCDCLTSKVFVLRQDNCFFSSFVDDRSSVEWWTDIDITRSFLIESNRRKQKWKSLTIIDLYFIGKISKTSWERGMFSNPFSSETR